MAVGEEGRLMGATFDRRTLLAGGAAAAAGFAAVNAFGLDLGGIAGATTNGPGRNGVSTATPKKGGSLVFGVDAEEPDAFSDNAWTAPSQPGTVHLWIVLRDERGGAGWKSFVVDVR